MTGRGVTAGGVAAAALLVAVACGGGGDDDALDRTSPAPPGTVTVTTSVPTTTMAPSAPTSEEPEPAPDVAAARVILTEVGRADAPIALARRGDAFYVAERAGRVRVLHRGQLGPPILDFAGDVSDGGERGLLGLAVAPDERHLYVSYTDSRGDSRIDEYALGTGVNDVDPASRREVIRVGQPFANHNGGHIMFGPDGLLWFGLGDGGAGGDPDGRAQNTDDVLGSLLRISPRPDGPSPYGVPGDNPFAGGGGRGEIAVYGLRNPWRFSFDRITGDLWIGDVGQNTVEEITRLPAASILGANLGWDYLEGTRRFEGEPPDGLVGPIHEYEQDRGRSVVGGFVYRGGAIPDLRGAYVFTDAYARRIWALAVDGGQVTGERVLVESPVSSMVSFAEDDGGELYVVSLEGPILRLDPA